MKIYGGENLESPRMKIHGGEMTEIKGDALNKLKIGGCPKQTKNRGDALNEMAIGGCPK